MAPYLPQKDDFEKYLNTTKNLRILCPNTCSKRMLNFAGFLLDNGEPFLKKEAYFEGKTLKAGLF